MRGSRRFLRVTNADDGGTQEGQQQAADMRSSEDEALQYTFTTRMLILCVEGKQRPPDTISLHGN